MRCVIYKISKSYFSNLILVCRLNMVQNHKLFWTREVHWCIWGQKLSQCIGTLSSWVCQAGAVCRQTRAPISRKLFCKFRFPPGQLGSVPCQRKGVKTQDSTSAAGRMKEKPELGDGGSARVTSVLSTCSYHCLWNSRAGFFLFQFGTHQTKLIPLSFMEGFFRNPLGWWITSVAADWLAAW